MIVSKVGDSIVLDCSQAEANDIHQALRYQADDEFRGRAFCDRLTALHHALGHIVQYNKGVRAIRRRSSDD
jgi:hypothetical protein